MGLYEDLGVARDASQEAIKAAYRKRASETHPDREGGNSDSFALVNHAYKVLKNPTRRAGYDAGQVDHTDPEAQMQSSIAHMVLQAIDEHGHDPNIDILLQVRIQLNQALAAGHETAEALAARIGQRKRALARIRKVGDGDNLIARLAQAEVDSLERQAAAIPAKIENLERAIAWVEEYEFAPMEEA